MERDAQRVQYASSVEAAQSTAAAAMSRLNGQAQAAAFRTASLGSILGAVSGYASSAQAQRSYELQVSSYERQLD
jgi:membrane protein YqaA with SNARE-associated domain